MYVIGFRIWNHREDGTVDDLLDIHIISSSSSSCNSNFVGFVTWNGFARDNAKPKDVMMTSSLFDTMLHYSRYTLST